MWTDVTAGIDSVSGARPHGVQPERYDSEDQRQYEIRIICV